MSKELLNKIIGNPIKMKHVIRWILYPPNSNIIQSWDLTNDICLFYCYPYLHNFFYLSNSLYNIPDMIDYYSSFEFNRDYLLFTIIDDAILNTNTEENITRNTNTIYSRRKASGIYGKPMYNQDIITNCLKIPNDKFIENVKMSKEHIINSLKQNKRFVNYDLYSFLNIIANKHGAESIVYPSDELHKSDWNKNCAWMENIKYGENDKTPSIYKDIDYNEINQKSIKNLEFIINKKIRLNNVRFTEPLLELNDVNGIISNVINCPITLKNFSI
jgi:hypothetical protein